ncbi:MAG TPA: hypothetical protein VFA54_14160 [Bryobacterales bacterium]|jgi:hypothetical protein|nr:hypothetical protein [Bryobacterales bacterium]
MIAKKASRFLIAALTIEWALAGGSSRAQEKLPAAETVLDQYVEVTGGREAYKKIHTQITIATMEFVGKGIKATLTSYKAIPHNSYNVAEMQGIGKIEQGTSGDIAWERSPLQGPRVKSGEERASALRDAALNAEWRELFKKAEMEGVENVGSRPCYKILLTPAEGSPETRYYDTKTHLLVKVNKVVKSQMGEIPAEVTLSDYRDAGGILVPHRVLQKGLGQEFLITIEKIEQNPEIPASRFDLPADVKALLEKSGAGGN